MAASAFYPVQYDILKDLDPISLLTISRLWLVSKMGCDIRGDWNRRRSCGGQIRGELSAASALTSVPAPHSVNAPTRRAPTGPDLPPARSDAGADDHSSHIINLHGLPAWRVFGRFVLRRRATLSRRPRQPIGSHQGDHRIDLRFGRAVDQALVGAKATPVAAKRGQAPRAARPARQHEQVDDRGATARRNHPRCLLTEVNRPLLLHCGNAGF